jgi:hypothetical protein
MIIFKQISKLFIVMSFLCADTDADVAVTGTGAIPFCASWETTTTAPDFSTVNMAAYDTDELIFTNIIAVTDFDSNYAFNITATKGTWTLPTGYLGTKQANGSDSDFLIIVNNITAGYGSDGLAAANSHSAYQAAVTGGAVIASGGTTSGTGSAHGVENASFDMDGKLLLDWDTDIPGTYTLAITITVASQ